MKPILFNTDMVRAILDGRKTVSRRAVKPRYRNGETGFRIVTNAHTGKYVRVEIFDEYEDETRWLPEPCRPGDILYVRETWAAWSRTYGIAPMPYYKADGDAPDGIKWRPSIHMPREAARIFLRVTDVRVERLRDITELDILEREGVTVDFPQPKPSYMSLAYTETRLKPAVRKSFADLWDSTIKPADRDLYSWAANPWVWVIEFERISREEAGL